MMLGLLLMLSVIVLPILAIGLLLGGAAIFQQNRARNSDNPAQFPVYRSTVNRDTPAVGPTRYCFFCGTGLQTGFTHCPRCGAPIQ